MVSVVFDAVHLRLLSLLSAVAALRSHLLLVPHHSIVRLSVASFLEDVADFVLHGFGLIHDGSLDQVASEAEKADIAIAVHSWDRHLMIDGVCAWSIALFWHTHLASSTTSEASEEVTEATHHGISHSAWSATNRRN